MVIALLSRSAGSGTSAMRFASARTVVHQLIVRHHLVDHADAQRLLRIEMIAGQRPAVCRLPAAQRGEQEARFGDVAHLRLREHRLVGRDGDVGGELIPEAAAHRPAVDGGDDRLAEPPHMLPFGDAAAVVALPVLDEFGDAFCPRDRRLRGPLGVPARPDRSRRRTRLPLPVSMITLTPRSASASSKARCSSASRLGDSAFIRSGRLSVMVAMRSLRRCRSDPCSSSVISCCSGCVADIDRDVDGDDAFARGLDDDRIEVERAELPGMGDGEVAEAHQQRRQRFDVGRLRPRAPSSTGAALMRWIARNASSCDSGAISVVTVAAALPCRTDALVRVRRSRRDATSASDITETAGSKTANSKRATARETPPGDATCPGAKSAPP